MIVTRCPSGAVSAGARQFARHLIPLVALALLVLAWAPELMAQGAQTPTALPAIAGGGGAGGAVGGAGAAAGGGLQSSTLIVNEQSNSIIVRTTPSNHRRIRSLIAKLNEDIPRDEELETRDFSLINISPAQLFEILRFELRGKFDPTKVLILPDPANNAAAAGAGAGGGGFSGGGR